MRLLVGYEGSQGAHAALREAVRLADAAHGEVLLLRVLNPLTDAAHIVAPSRTEAMRQVVATERAALEAVAREAGLPQASVLVEEREHGEEVADVIRRVATERSVDIIVISSRREPGVHERLLGSVTQAVLSGSRWPVLIVSS